MERNELLTKINEDLAKFSENEVEALREAALYILLQLSELEREEILLSHMKR